MIIFENYVLLNEDDEFAKVEMKNITRFFQEYTSGYT